MPPTLPNAILLIWTISSHLQDTFSIIEAWGFQYRAIAFWWRKVDHSGHPRIGGGYWFRQTGEICLLGIKGHPPRPIWKGEPAEITSQRQPKHSQKPEEAYHKIDRVFPAILYGPRLEMYARQKRPGWDIFGNQI